MTTLKLLPHLFFLLFYLSTSFAGKGRQGRKQTEPVSLPSSDATKPVTEEPESKLAKYTTKQMPHCYPSPPCPRKSFTNTDRVSAAIPDNERKILLEYSPKADSTSSTVMFFEEMGFKYGNHYSGFPHIFRQEYFNVKCGTVTPCMYTDRSWFRFKITRNPYDRAPSSFIHCFRTYLVHSVWTKERMDELSFYDFLLHLKKLPKPVFENAYGGHAGLQSSRYEREMYTKGVHLFHEIVQCEDPLPAISRINAKRGTHYVLNFTSKHFVKRNENVHHFLGKTPWKELKNNIPEDYGCFYNQEIKDLVTELYYADIFLYNYTFPFQFPNMTNNYIVENKQIVFDRPESEVIVDE
jgi:hypothetical protein